MQIIGLVCDRAIYHKSKLFLSELHNILKALIILDCYNKRPRIPYLHMAYPSARFCAAECPFCQRGFMPRKALYMSSICRLFCRDKGHIYIALPLCYYIICDGGSCQEHRGIISSWSATHNARWPLSTH